jgi:hypothetical protein
MFFDGPAERNRINARIDEERNRLHARIDDLERRVSVVDDLERRVARLEELDRRVAALEQTQDSRQEEGAPARGHDRRRSGTERFGRRTTDHLVRSPATDDGEAGREGARLVALEMLEAGYQPEQVTRYLSESFHVNAEDAARAVHGPPAG